MKKILSAVVNNILSDVVDLHTGVILIYRPTDYSLNSTVE